MSPVFEALPGIEVPVGSVSHRLAELWHDPHGDQDGKSVEDAIAMQVNLVLHLGLKTTPEDGVAQFTAAKDFAKRHPSRVVILCPHEGGANGTGMRAKVYGECHLGKSKGDKRCVEFVILGYPLEYRQYLENQVSVCLSSDLPLYYWAHAFSASARLADYKYLLTEARRVLIDSARAPKDALEYPWPKPAAVHALAHARLLPIRQSLGQFLSRYSMASICGGLRSVVVTHGAGYPAEAGVLLRWLRFRIDRCGTHQASFNVNGGGADSELAIEFTYDDNRYFRWRANFESGTAHFDASLEGAASRLDGRASLLQPAMALSEALFY
jgi:glucose-6-phosphate dehydrogenase assembly protein OpcA